MIINVKDVVVQGVNITVPTWVDWIAVDLSGVAWGYNKEPQKAPFDSFWVDNHDDEEESQQLFTAELTNNEKWQDLLFYVGD